MVWLAWLGWLAWLAWLAEFWPNYINGRAGGNVGSETGGKVLLILPFYKAIAGPSVVLIGALGAVPCLPWKG